MMDLALSALSTAYVDGATVRDVLADVLATCRQGPAGIWIHLADEATVLARAAELDELADGVRRLPLFGVPIAVKDNIDVAGMPTTAGCPAFAYVPDADASVVARLVAAGAVVVGKTNLDQFATGLTGTRTPYGVPTNPVAEGLVPGGSSVGSAVAVARGQVTAALGTDTAGSGRVPAAATGTYGWKPAPGDWPNDGVVPACRSLDCVSVFASDVDAMLAFAGVVAGERIDALGGPGCIAVPDQASRQEWSAPTRQAFGRELAALVAAGTELVEVDLAPWIEAGQLLYGGPWLAERTAGVGDFIAAHPGEVVPVVRDLILGGAAWSAVEAFRAEATLEVIARSVAQWWHRADALVLPTCDGLPTVADALADPVGSSAQLGRLTNAANLLGLAAVSFPRGRRDDGQPFGLTAFAPASRARVMAAIAGGRPSDLPSPVGPYDLAVVGAHLSGQPLNPLLTRRGARLVETTTTAATYRLWRLRGGVVARPGLERVQSGGVAVEVEVWRLDAAGFAAVVAEVAAPLGIGSVELADGRTVRGFICEPSGLEGATDISAFGGWRAALAAR